MNTIITKKQVAGLAYTAGYIRAAANTLEDDDCCSDVDLDILYDAGTFLLALTLELMPEDKEFDGFRDTINKHLNK